MEDLMNFDLPKDKSSIIKVVGVGGGGGNAVNYMCKQGIKDVDFVICNTDAQALTNSSVPVKIQLGSSLTEGRGAGNKPEIGKQAAIENLDDIIEVLSSNSKMVFITAGMGGGTGTGAAPIIAKQAKEMGILTVAIVTIPFKNEGERRINQALEGISEISEHVDSLLVINNEKIREIYGDLKVSAAFAQADNVLAVAAKGIAEIITLHGYINVDFADVQTVMTDSGVAILGSSKCEGEDRAINAVREALTSPLLNDNDIRGAKNILINITSGKEEITMDEIGEIKDYVQDCAGQEADLIWGNGVDETLQSEITVTVIATGFTHSDIPHLYAKKSQKRKVSLSDKNKVDNKFELDDSSKDIDMTGEEFKIHQGTIEFDGSEEDDDNFMLLDEDKLEKEKKSDDFIQASKKVSEIKKEHSKLKEKNYNNAENQEEIEYLENQPAYLRKKIKLKKDEKKDDSNVSKYSLETDENGDVRLSDDNPYLSRNIDVD